jgi:hypothetical protein
VSRPIGSKNKTKEDAFGVQPETIDITCTARTIRCIKRPPSFLNYEVLTLDIRNGQVVGITKTNKHLAEWEAAGILDILNKDSSHHLAAHFEDGKCWTK